MLGAVSQNRVEEWWEVNTSWVLIIISKVVFTLPVNVDGALYQNSAISVAGYGGGLLSLPVSSLSSRQPTSPLSSSPVPHLSSLNILARLWSSCQPVIVCHKTEPSLSPLTRARLQHRALTSKRGITSSKEVSVANQALICRDLLSWG